MTGVQTCALPICFPVTIPAIIIVDESQSLFVPEVQALTTRIGENAQMIFGGDNTGNQTDVKNGMDGLTYLNKIVQKYNIPDCQFITFTRDQICRSDVVRDFVIAFEEEMIADEKGLETVVSRADVDKNFVFILSTLPKLFINICTRFLRNDDDEDDEDFPNQKKVQS